MTDQNKEAIEALAEVWASIDGKDILFKRCKANSQLELIHGCYEVYMTEAEEAIERLASRGFQITKGWQPIDSAPKDGTVIRYQRRVDGKVEFEGKCQWRRFKAKALFSLLTNALYADPVDEMRWMHPEGEIDKCVPIPTHWQPLSEEGET